MQVRVDDLSGPQIHALLGEHLRSMHEVSPPGSVHALDIEKLRHPDVTFWTAWDGDQLLGCGALRELSPEHGEIKSMRTAEAHRERGVARAVVHRIIEEAKARGYARLSLETGGTKAFAPAHKLYESFGFTRCGPFADYVDDPHSVFMTMPL